jgi:hypothetical protein
VNDLMDIALGAAYQNYLAGCEKRCAAVVWSYQEWLDGSIIAASIINEYWTPKDGEQK